MGVEHLLLADERHAEYRSQHSQQLARQDFCQRERLRVQLTHTPGGLITLFCLGAGAGVGFEYLRRSVGTSWLKIGARVLWKKIARRL